MARLVLLAALGRNGLTLARALSTANALLAITLRTRVLLALATSLGRVLVVHLLLLLGGVLSVVGRQRFNFFTKK